MKLLLMALTIWQPFLGMVVLGVLTIILAGCCGQSLVKERGDP